MKQASITEAKNNLSALIDGLKSGESVLIMDRGRPVAWLEAATGLSDGESDARVAQLIRQGLLRPRRKPLDLELLREPPPQTKSGVSAVEMLLQERREGR
jgi:antitoxin (DNA-binding transcriptional repressor) of toxin-antitoxin stability system